MGEIHPLVWVAVALAIIGMVLPVQTGPVARCLGKTTIIQCGTAFVVFASFPVPGYNNIQRNCTGVLFSKPFEAVPAVVISFNADPNPNLFGVAATAWTNNTRVDGFQACVSQSASNNNVRETWNMTWIAHG